MPVAPTNRPSPVRSASSEPKRIHALSAATNAASSICAVLAATTYSSTLSMAVRAVKMRTQAPSLVPAWASTACRTRSCIDERAGPADGRPSVLKARAALCSVSPDEHAVSDGEAVAQAAARSRCRRDGARALAREIFWRRFTVRRQWTLRPNESVRCRTQYPSRSAAGP